MSPGPLPAINQRVDVWFDGYDEFYGGRVESVAAPHHFHVILDDGSSWHIDSRKHVFKLSTVIEDQVQETNLSISPQQSNLPSGIDVDQHPPTSESVLRRSKRERASAVNQAKNLSSRRRSSRIHSKDEDNKSSPPVTNIISRRQSSDIQQPITRRSSRTEKDPRIPDKDTAEMILSSPEKQKRTALRSSPRFSKEPVILDDDNTREEILSSAHTENVPKEGTANEIKNRRVTRSKKEFDQKSSMIKNAKNSGENEVENNEKKDQVEQIKKVDEDVQIDDEVLEPETTEKEDASGTKDADDEHQTRKDETPKVFTQMDVDHDDNDDDDPIPDPIEVKLSQETDVRKSKGESKISKPEGIDVDQGTPTASPAKKPLPPREAEPSELTDEIAIIKDRTSPNGRKEMEKGNTKPPTAAKDSDRDDRTKSKCIDDVEMVDVENNEDRGKNKIIKSKLEEDTHKSAKLDVTVDVEKPDSSKLDSPTRLKKDIVLEEEVFTPEITPRKNPVKDVDRGLSKTKLAVIVPATPPRRRSAGRALRKSVGRPAATVDVTPPIAPTLEEDTIIDEEMETMKNAISPKSRRPEAARARRTYFPPNNNDSLSTDLRPPVRPPSRQAIRKQRQETVPANRYNSGVNRKRKMKEAEIDDEDDDEDDELPEVHVPQDSGRGVTSKRIKRVEVDNINAAIPMRRASRQTVTFQGTDAYGNKVADKGDDRERPVVERLSPKAITALAVDAALEAAKAVLRPLNDRLTSLMSDLEMISKEALKAAKKKQAPPPKRPVLSGAVIPKAVTTAGLESFQLDISEIIGGGEARIKAYSSLSEQEFDLLHRVIEQQGVALQELDRLLYAAQAFSQKGKQDDK